MSDIGLHFSTRFFFLFFNNLEYDSLFLSVDSRLLLCGNHEEQDFIF